MTYKRPGNKFLRISGYVLGFLLVALVAFHFWFKAHARQLIEDMVESRSNGRLRLKVGKFNFNWFSEKMEFRDAVFFSTDTATASTAYSFSVDRIKLKVDAILPIVFNKRMIIDTLTLLDPDIRVTRLKRSEKKEKGTEQDVSLPEEMGKIYNSIQDALKVLRVSRFNIDRGKFTLINNLKPGQRPITIGNIFFQIDNLTVDTTIRGARDRILFSDNVILRSHDQDILFPDERHKLSFSKFSINLQKKLVEFDSCTIAAIRTDSSAAAFTMYMDALKLIDIDFDTLYKTEVIKADSVYAVNPKFTLDVELGRKKDPNKPAPKLENIIKQLTGNLELENVVVSNADFNIRTMRDGVPNSFTFNQNSFEINGLTIDQDAKSPIKVRSFAMAIRNYENFIKDSTYSVQFDSVLFRDDRIHLSNFVFHKLNNGRILNSFNIPRFYLGGLSWDDLVFERRLKADQATLFNPVIAYTVSSKLRGKSGNQSIFHSIAEINEMMDLRYLDIVDGNIDLKVNEQIRIQLEEATLSIQSNDLLQATKLAGIKNSLTQMDFRKGIIRAGDVLLNLDNIRYLGESGKFSAGGVEMKDVHNQFSIALSDVVVDKMLVNEQTGDIYSENISWGKGNIDLSIGSGSKDLRSILELHNIRGTNTELTGRTGNSRFTTHIDNVSFDHLSKVPGKKINIVNVEINGKDFIFTDKLTDLSISGYQFRDEKNSGITNFKYKNKGTEIRVPSAGLIPHLASIISGYPRFDKVSLTRPVIRSAGGEGTNGISLPGMEISELKIDQPEIEISGKNANGNYRLLWKGENSPDHLDITGLVSRKEKNDISIENIQLLMNHFNFITASGKSIDTREGSIRMELRDLSFNERKGINSNWRAILSTAIIKDLLFDSLGKKNGRLMINDAKLKEVGMTSTSTINIQELAAANSAFELSGFNGSFENNDTRMSWKNVALNRSTRKFSADSFAMKPILDRDSFMAKQSYQTDHLSLVTSAITLNEFKFTEFIRNYSISGNELQVKSPFLDIYRDNTLPFREGINKPLPVKLLEKLPFDLSLEKMVINNGRVDYTQRIDTSKPALYIPVTNLALTVNGAKNHGQSTTDSLEINVTGIVFDTAHISIQFRESFFDSLYGFRLTAQFRPLDIKMISPVLEPLAGIRIKSGFMDTTRVLVHANENFAYGEMEMKYRDLKVQVLKIDEEKGTRVNPVRTFLANTLLIRNKNRKRTGVIIIDRDKERSAINYLVKIAMNGFSDNIGIKNNRRELKKKNLLPVELDPAKPNK